MTLLPAPLPRVCLMPRFNPSRDGSKNARFNRTSIMKGKLVGSTELFHAGLHRMFNEPFLTPAMATVSNLQGLESRLFLYKRLGSAYSPREWSPANFLLGSSVVLPNIRAVKRDLNAFLAHP